MNTASDIEQFAYLGLLLAMRHSVPRSRLREDAHLCAARREKNLRFWIENDEMPRVETEGLDKFLAATREGGVIVTSFQTGHYNWIPQILNHFAQAPVTVLMDAANDELEQRRWSRRENRYRGVMVEPVRRINSQEPTAVWKMASALREGRALVGWMDGHTGVTAAHSAKSSLTIRFLESHTWIRAGLPYLSTQTNAPLMLAFVEDADAGIKISFCDPLHRQATESAEDFCRRASHTLYAALERNVLRDVTCWEEWCHLHHWNIFEDDLTDRLDMDSTYHLDAMNTETLHLSEGDVLVSLRSGHALALTPLITSLMEVLSSPIAPGNLAARLARAFPEQEIHSALEVLYRERFVIAAATGDKPDTTVP